LPAADLERPRQGVPEILQRRSWRSQAAAQTRCQGRFRFPDPKQFRLRVADDGDAFLILPKFGKTKKDHGPLRIRMHRPLPAGARIKTVTLAQEADWWFASLNCEAEVAAAAPSPNPRERRMSGWRFR
jgi:hypothetical protein